LQFKSTAIKNRFQFFSCTDGDVLADDSSMCDWELVTGEYKGRHDAGNVNDDDTGGAAGIDGYTEEDRIPKKSRQIEDLLTKKTLFKCDVSETNSNKLYLCINNLPTRDRIDAHKGCVLYAPPDKLAEHYVFILNKLLWGETISITHLNKIMVNNFTIKPITKIVITNGTRPSKTRSILMRVRIQESTTIDFREHIYVPNKVNALVVINCYINNLTEAHARVLAQM
jgi:hypothetical protein